MSLDITNKMKRLNLHSNSFNSGTGAVVTIVPIGHYIFNFSKALVLKCRVNMYYWFKAQAHALHCILARGLNLKDYVGRIISIIGT